MHFAHKFHLYVSYDSYNKQSVDRYHSPKREPMEGSVHTVMNIAFCKRGKSCWQASQRKTVVLWDVTLQCLAPTLQNILPSSGFCTVIVVPGSITSQTQLGRGGQMHLQFFFLPKNSFFWPLSRRQTNKNNWNESGGKGGCAY